MLHPGLLALTESEAQFELHLPQKLLQKVQAKSKHGVMVSKQNVTTVTDESKTMWSRNGN